TGFAPPSWGASGALSESEAPAEPGARRRDNMSKLVGLVGSGRVARDPFDPRQWSGSSSFFFTELQRRNALRRAFGVEVPAWRRAFYLARNFHLRRAVWREHFYADVGYRQAL